VAQEESVAQDDGGAQRVNLSGKLRMLSQRVPAAACYLQNGVDVERSRAVLTGALAEFEQIVAGLEHGDMELGIPTAEERRRTLAGIAKLNELWVPLRQDANAILDGTGTPEHLASMASQSAEVLAVAQKLVVVISGQYANQAELLQSDTMLIDVAGRQRMLSQRMSKNACLASSGIASDVAIAELQGAHDTYHNSLFALYGGMQSAGINPPPTDEIEAALGEVIARWGGLEPLVQQVLDGGALSSDEKAVLFNGANAMTGEMNTIVGMYSVASNLGD
ncbi:MAG: type IV pili methyl-accepting chemotaxis transducer N-terminal domain-containing protein, partial [Pseudomonadota bacterium]